MAKKQSRQEQLVERLHADGIRKRVAAAIAGTRGGGRKKAEGVARDVLKQLEDASDTIRREVLRDGSKSTKRSEAAKKAAKTRAKNAAKRSASAKKGAATRAKSSGNGRAKSGTRAKAGAKK